MPKLLLRVLPVGCRRQSVKHVSFTLPWARDPFPKPYSHLGHTQTLHRRTVSVTVSVDHRISLIMRAPEFGPRIVVDLLGCLTTFHSVIGGKMRIGNITKAEV